MNGQQPSQARSASFDLATADSGHDWANLAAPRPRRAAVAPANCLHFPDRRSLDRSHPRRSTGRLHRRTRQLRQRRRLHHLAQPQDPHSPRRHDCPGGHRTRSPARPRPAARADRQARTLRHDPLHRHPQSRSRLRRLPSCQLRRHRHHHSHIPARLQLGWNRLARPPHRNHRGCHQPHSECHGHHHCPPRRGRL